MDGIREFRQQQLNCTAMISYIQKQWATDTINLGTWETASSIIAVGLTWRDAIPIMVRSPYTPYLHDQASHLSRFAERFVSLYPWS